MKSFQATAVSEGAYRLAEGPVWDEQRERVLWVDIAAGEILEGALDGSRVRERRRHTVGSTVGAVVSSADGRLLVACAQTVRPLELEDAELRIVPQSKASRLNDGGCDPSGRFLVGSLALDGREGEESLCRVEDDLTLTVLDDDLTLSNGVAWSLDGKEMYSVDSIPGIIWAREYEAVPGTVGARRELFRVDDGIPDGLCVDARGDLWVAIWGPGEVRCYSLQGEVLAIVDVAAPHTTSVAFVGADRDRLLITTACIELSPGQLTRFPNSGRLFIANVDAQGIPTTPWSGTWPTARAERSS